MKLLIGAIVVVLIALGAWFGTRPSTPVVDTVLEAQVQATETEEVPTRGALSSLFGMTGSFKCTVTSYAPNSFSSGVVYVQDGNVRGEFDTTSQGGAMKAMMIKTGEHVYTWSSAMPMGVKAKATSLEGGNGGTPTQDSQMFDAGVAVDYSCEPATVDAALFVPPTDIQFMDMSSGAMPDVSKMMQ